MSFETEAEARAHFATVVAKITEAIAEGSLVIDELMPDSQTPHALLLAEVGRPERILWHVWEEDDAAPFEVFRITSANIEDLKDRFVGHINGNIEIKSTDIPPCVLRN